jgi:hypothetical protein
MINKSDLNRAADVHKKNEALTIQNQEKYIDLLHIKN